MTIIWIVLGIILIGFIGFVLMGIFHLRGSIHKIEKAAMEVKITQIPGLTQECIRVFDQKLKKKLSLNDFQAAAQIMDNALHKDNLEATKHAFASEDLYWRFVLPMGAFLGELVRANTPAEWKPSPLGGSLALETQTMGFLHPFDKILKQVETGDPGDLQAYVSLSIKGTSGQISI